MNARHVQHHGGEDEQDPERVEPLVHTVLQALRRHATDGEWDDIMSGMPRDLAAVLA